MATKFYVYGPFEIPCYKGKACRTITEDEISQFWKQNHMHATQRGCYVFGIRAAKGATPGYVGQAKKGFKQEAFAPHKLAKYQQLLADCLRGTPVLYFVTPPKKAGKPNDTHIKELENFLIQVGVAANSDILNIKGTKIVEWGIAGVIRGGKGKPNKATKQFRTMMKI